MKKKLLISLLLLAMSFSAVHSYVIAVFDTHNSQVNEYVHNFSGEMNAADDDICHLHHFFHIAFILPEMSVGILDKGFAQKPDALIKRYEYNSQENFLKPPIFL